MGVLVDNKSNAASAEGVKDNAVTGQAPLNGQIPTQVSGHLPQQVSFTSQWLASLISSVNGSQYSNSTFYTQYRKAIPEYAEHKKQLFIRNCLVEDFSLY